MGEALAAGLIQHGWDPASLAIAEIEGDRRRVLEERLPGVRLVPTPSCGETSACCVISQPRPR